MKRDFLILLILLVCTMGATAWGICPQDSVDTGVCDTMYIEPWEPDVADSVWTRPGPYFIKVPIYVTHDVSEDNDQLAAFVIPLCLTRNNPTKYCSVSTYMNRILWSGTNLDRSIFRHLPSNQDIQVHNWMMDLFDVGEGGEWDNVILDLDGTTHYWLTLIAGGEDPLLPAGIRTLLVTMTAKLQDTMTICVDTCFWPPSSALAFSRKDSKTFIPRFGEAHPICFGSGTSDVREVEGSDINTPIEFSLSQNYPNPFNPVTNFQFMVSKSAHVKIEIYNIVGQKVRMLVDEDMKPGVYSADWNGKDENGNSVSSGVYFYRMLAGDFSDMKKMVLIK